MVCGPSRVMIMVFHSGPGLPGLAERLGEGIESAGDVILVFAGSFRMVVDLHFVAVVDGHPFLARLDGNANEDAGIVVVVAHFVDDADSAIADFTAGPIEKAHAAVSFDQAIFDGHVARARRASSR